MVKLQRCMRETFMSALSNESLSHSICMEVALPFLIYDLPANRIENIIERGVCNGTGYVVSGEYIFQYADDGVSHCRYRLSGRKY